MGVNREGPHFQSRCGFWQLGVEELRPGQAPTCQVSPGKKRASSCARITAARGGGPQDVGGAGAR